MAGLFDQLDELMSEALADAVAEVLDIELGPNDLAQMTTLVVDSLASAVMDAWGAQS